MRQWTWQWKVLAVSRRKLETKSGEPKGVPSRRVPSVRCDCGVSRARAVGSVGSGLGQDGWSVERIVVLRGLREAPSGSPTVWNVVKYAGMAETGRTEDTSSM